MKKEDLEAPRRDFTARSRMLPPRPTGWPSSAIWPGMPGSLFGAGLGDFLAVTVDSAGRPRNQIGRMHSTLRIQSSGRSCAPKILRQVPADYDAATQVEETPHTLVCTQTFGAPAPGAKRPAAWSSGNGIRARG
jgi:hypothetical protein